MDRELPLNEPEIHLWTVDATSIAEPGGFFDLLSPDERERANRFRREQDWVRFVVFRAVLRKLLGRYLGQDPAAILFRYAPKGKPSVAGGGIEFNVSHSHDRAVYAFGVGELGVDVEFIREIEIEAIARRFFTPDECVWILSSETPTRAFFDCWTRKEAYIKAEGGGLSIPLDTFSVLEPLPWHLYSWAPADGYIAAAAVKGPKSFIHRRVDRR
jgi:4'-phosphopantetheinyl transferase